MATYMATIESSDGRVWHINDRTSYELVKWLQDRAKELKKEPYLVPRFEGEVPLEGLERRSDERLQ